MPKQHAAEWPGQETDSKRTECGKLGNGRAQIRGEKQLWKNQSGSGSVNEKIIPFDRRPGSAVNAVFRFSVSPQAMPFFVPPGRIICFSVTPKTSIEQFAGENRRACIAPDYAGTRARLRIRNSCCDCRGPEAGRSSFFRAEIWGSRSIIFSATSSASPMNAPSVRVT